MTTTISTRDNLGPMGQITTWATQYHQGLIDLDVLIGNLQTFNWRTPGRFAEIPADLFVAEAQAEERTYEDEDTFDEVLAARDRGLLTTEDLLAVAAALEAGADGGD